MDRTDPSPPRPDPDDRRLPDPAEADEFGDRYSVWARLLHWITVVLVGSTIPVGIAMTSEGFGAIGNELYVTHKSLGVVIGIVVVVRLTWRLVGDRPPPLPGFVPPVEVRLARWTHRALYLLLLGMAVSGYVRTAAGDYPVEILDVLGIPPLVPVMPELATRLSVLHKFGAWLLVVTATLHVSAVSYHGMVLRNGIPGRMWPPVGGDGA
jgi:cytochrome b561